MHFPDRNFIFYKNSALLAMVSVFLESSIPRAEENATETPKWVLLVGRRLLAPVRTYGGSLLQLQQQNWLMAFAIRQFWRREEDSNLRTCSHVTRFRGFLSQKWLKMPVFIYFKDDSKMLPPLFFVFFNLFEFFFFVFKCFFLLCYALFCSCSFDYFGGLAIYFEIVVAYIVIA